MFHSAPARPGKQVAQGVDSIGLAVARVTWKISLASSGSEIWCAPAASRLEEHTSADTPAVCGLAVVMEPFFVGTLWIERAPSVVRVVLLRHVVAVTSSLSDF